MTIALAMTVIGAIGLLYCWYQLKAYRQKINRASKRITTERYNENQRLMDRGHILTWQNQLDRTKNIRLVSGVVFAAGILSYLWMIVLTWLIYFGLAQ